MRSFNSRRESAVSCAYPPVCPIAHVVSPDHSIQFGYRVVLGSIVSAVKQFIFHSRPHTLAASIIMTSTAVAVHALDYAILSYDITVFGACVLAATVGVYYAACNVRVCFPCVLQRATAKRCSHIYLQLQVQEASDRSNQILRKHMLYRL